MKLAPVMQLSDLENEIKKRFADFHKSNPLPKKSLRFPRELQELVGRAAAHGAQVSALSQWANVATSTVHRWAHVKNVSKVKARPKRLKVVHDEKMDMSSSEGKLHMQAAASVACVRFPSGVAIELFEVRALSTELLAALGRMEVYHVTSR